jgi:transposase
MKRADRQGYPTDVSDKEWSFALPYLTLMDVDAPQRKYELRDMFDALRWMARAVAPWRMLPNDFPPWGLVYQQTQRWLQAGCFESMVSELRLVMRMAQSRRVRIPRKSSCRTTAKRAGIPREAERRFHSKASAADVATRGEFFYSFSSSVVKPFRRLRIDSPDSVSRCAL